MIEFLKEHYRLFAFVACFIVELVLSVILIVKKQKKEAPIFTEILMLLPAVIDSVEKSVGAGNGQLKMSLVIDAVKRWASHYGVSLDALTIKRIEAAAESILSTPQKKGD